MRASRCAATAETAPLAAAVRMTFSRDLQFIALVRRDSSSVASLVPCYTENMDQDWERKIDDCVDEAVQHVYRKVFHGDLTSAQARLVWLKIIGKMLESAAIDASTHVVSEALCLKRR
jgi:hypothetical protein